MDTRMIISIGQFALTMLILVAGTTAFIKVKFNDLRHLTGNLEEIKGKLTKLDDKIDNLSDRVSKIEGKIEN